MIRKPTWILLALLAVVASLAWYLEFAPGRAQAHLTPSPTTAVKLLADVASLSMTRIEVNQNAGEKVTVVRDAKGEYVFEGQTGKGVDQGAVFEMASELAAMQVIDTIQSNVNEEKIGLAAPTASVLIESANGNRHTIKVGNQTPVSNGYYIRVDTQAPVVVSKEAIDRILAMATMEALTAPTATPPGIPEVMTPTP